MNKIFVTEPHLFICIVGPSGSGKTALLSKLLNKRKVLFKPNFDKFFYFYKHPQSIYSVIEQQLGDEIEFIQGLNWDRINYLEDSLRKLLIFDDLYDTLGSSDDFLNLVVSGRHRNAHIILLKHNLYQKSNHSKTLDLNMTHLLLLKNPRDIMQIDCLGRQLGCREHLLTSYKRATEKAYGHLLVDLDPRCCEELRFASNIDESFTVFYINCANGQQQEKIPLDATNADSKYSELAFEF